MAGLTPEGSSCLSECASQHCNSTQHLLHILTGNHQCATGSMREGAACDLHKTLSHVTMDMHRVRPLVHNRNHTGEDCTDPHR